MIVDLVTALATFLALPRMLVKVYRKKNKSEVVTQSVRMRSPGSGSKILPGSCWTARLKSQQFDAIAEAAQFPDDPLSALLSRALAYSGAPFFVVHTLMQNDPDQATKPMCNRSDSLVVSQARYQAAIHDLEDASFGFDRSVGTLIGQLAAELAERRGQVVGDSAGRVPVWIGYGMACSQN